MDKTVLLLMALVLFQGCLLDEGSSVDQNTVQSSHPNSGVNIASELIGDEISGSGLYVIKRGEDNAEQHILVVGATDRSSGTQFSMHLTDDEGVTGRTISIVDERDVDVNMRIDGLRYRARRGTLRIDVEVGASAEDHRLTGNMELEFFETEHPDDLISATVTLDGFIDISCLEGGTLKGSDGREQMDNVQVECVD